MDKQVGYYTTLEINDNQDLVITLTDEGRKKIKSDTFTRSFVDSGTLFWLLLEDHLCNEWDFVSPEWIGALTDAPIITQHLSYSAADGHEVVNGPVYWYPDYQVIDPITDLFENGSITFDVSKD